MRVSGDDDGRCEWSLTSRLTFRNAEAHRRSGGRLATRARQAYQLIRPDPRRTLGIATQGGRPKDVTGSRRLWSAVAVTSFGLAAVGWVLRTSALQAINQANTQADAVGASLERLVASLATMGTAERGLAIMGREADSQALASAAAGVDRALAAVASLTASLPQKGSMESLRMLVAEAVTTSRQTARMRKAEGAEAAMRRATSDEDQVLREHVRRAAGDLAAVARQEAEKAQAAAGSRSVVASTLGVCGGLAGLASVLFGLWGVGRPLRQEEYRSAVREDGPSAEPMLPSILGTLDDAVLAIDAHGKVMASNPAAESLLGLGESGGGSRALYAPDAGKKGPPAESPLLRALKGHSIKGALLSVGRPNEPGSRQVSVSAKPVLDPEGRTQGAVMILRDLSDAPDDSAPAPGAEVPLARAPEDAFGEVFEDAPIGIALLGTDGRVARANGALCRLLGCLPEELVGRDPGKLVQPEDVKKEAPLLRQLMSGAIPSYEMEKRFTIKTRDKGKEVPLLVRWSACAVRAATGEITGALAFVEEVKEKKPEGRLARESQEVLRLVLDTVPVGVWVTDVEGRVKLANPAGRKIWSKDEAVARFEEGEYKGWWADSGKRIAPDEWGALRAIATGEAQVDKAIQVQRFDGTRKTLLTSTVPLRAGDGSTSGAVVVQQELPSASEGPRAESPDAKAQLEALAAIVPLCPSCEKRREDPAYWKQVRTYVRENRAELRAATCQECSSRAYDLWGELIDEKTVAGES
jgi:PAS domain S-box-containing protein